jgi:hypothetical protein
MSQEQVIKEIGVRREDPAYRNGWEDGRFGPTQLFLGNSNLAGWAGPRDAGAQGLAIHRGVRGR